MMNLRNALRRGGLRALLLVPLIALAPACTDLDEVPNDALTPENAFRTEAEILAGVASVYAGLRGTMWGVYNLSEVSTDEVVVPTRGSDWFDNGRWLEIHRQTWTPNSGSALDDMNGAWNDLFSGVARSNLMINVIQQQPASEQKDRTLAELRVLRAWYYYLLMDFFGGVPLVTTTEVGQRPRESRDSIFRFIEQELLASREDLPDEWADAFYGRVTRGAANAILASLYLNAQVYTGTVTAAGLQPGTARWQDAIDAADEVINSSVYNLEPDWRANFSHDNFNSSENIFVIAMSPLAGLGQSLPMRTLHYDQLNPSPWNGFATLAETYNAFSPNDARRNMFLVGPQTKFHEPGVPALVRGTNTQLDYSVSIGDIDAAEEWEGARFNKFPPLPNALNGDSHPNDFTIFRLAEMYLIKAEALAELGQLGPAAVQLNIVRARSFEPDQPVAFANIGAARTAILDERLFELAGEAKRRRDLIRFGRYTEARAASEKAAQPGYKILFPIPEIQRQSNPLLTQNPGY